jgi:hypothetical protein
MKEHNEISMILNTALKVNEDKRKSTRIPLKARVSMVRDGETVEGELVNLSLNGAFVTSDKPLEVDSSVIITIFGAPSTRIISGVKAKVVRAAGNGMGLLFE